MVSVFLLLGSNLGDRLYYLNEAIRLIGEQIAKADRRSSVYETQSWGKTDAPDYLNQVVVITTNLPAKTVLARILEIELLLGRHREEKWGSRTIDIDILFYGDEIIMEAGLQIPHPELHKRRFTLEPMEELEPGMVHPIINKNISDIKNELKDDLIVKKLYF